MQKSSDFSGEIEHVLLSLATKPHPQSWLTLSIVWHPL